MNNMLLYFWKEKGDPKRWIGYEEWAENNVEDARTLEHLLRNIKLTENSVTDFLELLTEDCDE